MKRWLPGLIAVSLFIGGGLPVLFAQVGRTGADLYFPPELFTDQSPKAVPISSSFTTVPFLPMIFFDAPGDAEIPARYLEKGDSLIADGSSGKLRAKGLSIDLSRAETSLTPHHRIFDVLAFRLRYYHVSRLTLTGCYADEPGEDGRVARARAEAVRDRLVEEYGIDSRRITIAPSRQVLQQPEAVIADMADFREEARRVEIASETTQLFDEMIVTINELRPWSTTLEFSLRHYVDSTEVEAVSFETSVAGERTGERRIYISEPRNLYTFTGEWELPTSLLAERPDRILINATLHLRDNSTRRVNPLVIPLSYERPEPYGRFPSNSRPTGAEGGVVGTLFFDEGSSRIGSNAGISIPQIVNRLRRGKVELTSYHVVDERNNSVKEGIDGPLNQVIALVGAADDMSKSGKGEIQVTLTCGWGRYSVYEGGLVGVREEGELPEESPISSSALELVEARRLQLSMAVAAQVQEETRQESESAGFVNRRRYLGTSALVQRVQTIYPASLPEGRFYRRAVRLIAHY